MKFYKILSTALLFPALMAISSCEEEMSNYTPAEPTTGAQVYFEGAVNTNFVVNAVDSVFTVKLTRVQKDSVATIALKAEADSATLTKFSFPSVATFAAGEATTTISCVAKVDSMEFDTPYTVKLCIANEEDATLYGQSFVNLKVTCPAPWKSLGMGKFSEGFLGTAGEYFDVEILQNELAPNQFRVVEPYAEILGDIAVDKYLDFTILPAGTAFKDYVLDAEYVVFNDYNMGQWNSNYAEDIFALHPYRFGMTLDLWAYNVVLDYQENGLPGEVSLAPYFYLFEQGGGWNQTKETTISILFPGYVKADYSSALEFAGLFTKPDGSMFAVGNLALGADAAEVKAIVMPADADAAAVADAIAAGELEAMDVEAGRIEVPFNAEELGGNNFQIVTVVLFEGAVKSVATASFEYYGGGNNPWQSLGTGHYTDDILSSMWGLPTATYEVEILEHTENPGLYRLVNPYNNQVYPAEYVEVFASQLSNSLAPAGYNLEVNAMDPEGVYIPVQALGLDFGDGEWSFETEGSRYLAKYDIATLKKNGYMGAVIDGVIKFPKFPFTASDGSEKVYQGILYEGASGFYSATNGQLEIVLPGANAFARNMAIAKSNTTKREVAKMVFSGVKATKKINKLRNLIAETF